MSIVGVLALLAVCEVALHQGPAIFQSRADGRRLRGSTKASSEDSAVVQTCHKSGGRIICTTSRASGGGSIYQQYAYAIDQFIIGIVFYFLVQSKYPKLTSAPNEDSRKVMGEATCFRFGSGQRCFIGWCCPAAGIAHVLNATLEVNYWLALFVGSFYPGATTLYAISFTDMNVRLGGEKKSCFTGFWEGCCCACCTINQVNEALDECTRAKTECCQVGQMRETDAEYG